ncbi:MAG TPA: ABC-F family ATP-binding cassette domain-containing protein [Actinomycetota bacterium]|nr:ABC-F family ATP-binding cassette domain-containing protein [Actinomycetota bacterium]
MIDISGVIKSFGSRVLLRDVSLRVGARDRVALVGPNGSGKTTLFAMIVGSQLPDSGRIDIVRDAVVGYLPQETDELRGRSVLAEVMSAGAAMAKAGHRLEVLEHELEQTDDPQEREALLAEYARLQGEFDTLGGYSLEAQAKRIMSGLGFSERDQARQTESLSGGWLMRVALAKLLLAGPDVLLLDEPTNHLDLESVTWLERFLRGYEGAVLLISHDRDFMNGLATKVASIEDSRLVTYTGNFQDFVRQREERAALLEAAAKNQAKKIAHTEAFINRFRYKASKARQVQSRIKSLDKLERVQSPSAQRKAMKLGFPAPPRSGRVVITLDDVSFSYPDTSVYESLQLEVERGQKVALVGPNGAGKTTLLKLLAGALQPQAGERRLGHNVSLGYFAQHQIEALDPGNRVIEELQKAVPVGSSVRPRDLLGRFLFSGDDIDKPVRVLSGGEQTRLALSKLLASPLNVLCLDEPTNHLDIVSRDVLEDALADYEGCIVLITHDRHLIRSVANRILEVREGRVRSFEGDYEYYLYKTGQEDSASAVSSGPAAPAPERRTRPDLSPKDRRRQAADERRRLKEARDAVSRLESELESAQEECARLGAELEDPSFYLSGSGVNETIKRYERMRRQVAKLEAEWIRAGAELEEASS